MKGPGLPGPLVGSRQSDLCECDDQYRDADDDEPPSGLVSPRFGNTDETGHDRDERDEREWPINHGMYASFPNYSTFYFICQ